MDIRTLHFDSLPSTNDEALSQAKRGADEGLCVIANFQTSGRGRSGRQWFSEPGSGLCFSAVLRPKFEERRFPVITLMAAVAVAEMLRDTCSIEADIKWPNDILVDEKKICGILAESSETSLGPAVIVGIGINRTPDAVPADLSEDATSIESETGTGCDPAVLLDSLVKYFFYHYRQLEGENGARTVISRWKELSSYAYGKNVSVALGSERFEGTTDGLDSDGALIVKTQDGLRTVKAGDVTRVRESD